MDLLTWYAQSDVISQAVAWLLLLMSIASWVVMLWKAWLLRRVSADLPRATAACWHAATLPDAAPQVAVFDRDGLLLPLVQAWVPQPQGTLAAHADRSQQLTRVLRDALHAVVRRLQYGQVLLATVGATAPFVGLLGTVWGIYQALVGMASAGQITLERITGPVGEALIMTAAGLAVAIPAVLAYNVMGRVIAQLEADLEGFALDLRDLLLTQVPDPTAAAAAA